MKGGFYIRLAKDGIVKNRKLYFPYILTCICMIMMFYIIYYLGFSADFTSVRGGDMLQSFLMIGVFIMAWKRIVQIVREGNGIRLMLALVYGSQTTPHAGD